MIDNYDSFTYNLVQYFYEMDQEVEVYRNDEITISQITKKSPEYLVISPGPCTPKEAGISIEVIKPDVSNDETLSKIIKIMVKTPKIGERRLDNLSELKSGNFAWTTKEFNKNIETKNYHLINEDKIFYPWKLIYKK